VIAFVPFLGYRQGSIAELLVESYAELLRELSPTRAEGLRSEWEQYDAGVYRLPDSVGACGFFTRLEDEVIGFGSWDPRGWPEVGEIGHNCVLPSHRGRGYGQRQIEEILRRFRSGRFRRARVRTDGHPFFGPARRIYEKCEFKEIGREPGTLVEGYETIVYEWQVTNSVA
jgi:GNAT superfamily N-acetyltransferase